MSILIKGIKMPSGCYTCPIIYSEDGAFDFECPFNSYLHWHNAEDVINYIPDSCLLVAVPTPHGRLIDADKLLESFREALDEDRHFVNFFALVDDSPTVIEAEVSDNA